MEDKETATGQTTSVERLLCNFMHTLLSAGMSIEETVRQGFILAEELASSMPMERLFTNHAIANCKLQAAVSLKQAARSLGIDLESQRSTQEKHE